MLKFIKGHMESITGIEIFPLISFIIFFTFFVLMLIYLVKADKKRLDYLAAMPLNDNTNTPDDEE